MNVRHTGSNKQQTMQLSLINVKHAKPLPSLHGVSQGQSPQPRRHHPLRLQSHLSHSQRYPRNIQCSQGTLRSLSPTQPVVSTVSCKSQPEREAKKTHFHRVAALLKKVEEATRVRRYPVLVFSNYTRVHLRQRFLCVRPVNIGGLE